jgi:hypothetical protein
MNTDLMTLYLLYIKLTRKIHVNFPPAGRQKSQININQTFT